MSTGTALRGLPLLDAVIVQIEVHPETWRQDTYRCGTGMCVAGWGAEMAGGRWVNVHPVSERDDALWPEPDDNPDEVICGAIDAHARARRLFGIDKDAASELFAGDNTLDRIKAIRDRLAAGLPVGK